MVFVAQLVRALDCGSRGRRFESGLTPLLQKTASVQTRSFFYFMSPDMAQYGVFLRPDFTPKYQYSPQNESFRR